MSFLNIIILFLLLPSWTLPNDSISLSLREKVFRSYVSVDAIGNAYEAIRDKTSLEQSFKLAYSKMIDQICAFRSIEGISLVDVKENINALVNRTDNISESGIFLHFEMTIKCFDCPNDGLLFESVKLGDERRGLQIDIEQNCYWDDNSIAEVSINNSNITQAPLTDDFVEKFKETIQEQKFTSIKEVIDVVDNSQLIIEESIFCPCPKDSFCTYTNNWEKDFWRISEGLFYNCTCKIGYYGGDGWRCELVNECEMDWPCAHPDEGGYCVDTHPNDVQYPMYKCGCKPGYIPNEMYPPDIHGVKFCLDESYNSDNKIGDDVEDTEDYIIENDFNITKAPPPEYCSDERLIGSYLSFKNLTCDSEAVKNEKHAIEQAIQIAYKGSIRSSCLLRSLEIVTMTGFRYSNGTYENLTDSITTDRYLEESHNVIISETNSGLEFNNTDIEELEDDDDIGVNLNFNFSIFFAMIMRCYGCPEDALLFDDASRRLSLSSQSVVDEDSCSCEEDDTSRSLQEFEGDINVSPLKIVFLEILSKTFEEKGIDSIKTEDIQSIEQEEGGPFIEIKIPKEKEECKCDAVAQECVDDGVCICKAGFVAYSERGGKCIDLKECENNDLNECHRNAKCIEIMGSYACECEEGYHGDGFSCEKESKTPTIQPPTLEPTKVLQVLTSIPTIVPMVTRTYQPIYTPMPTVTNPGLTLRPSKAPIDTPMPTVATPDPTLQPSKNPIDADTPTVTTQDPTSQPSNAPIDTPMPTPDPTLQPSKTPIDTPMPTVATPNPSLQPSNAPIDTPMPTVATPDPTLQPSNALIDTSMPIVVTPGPTSQPSKTPIDTPMPTVATPDPTLQPSNAPIDTPMPTVATPDPTLQPSTAPINTPVPTVANPNPTSQPSFQIPPFLNSPQFISN